MNAPQKLTPAFADPAALQALANSWVWRIRLEPLTEAHAKALTPHALAPEVWRFLLCKAPQDFFEVREWVRGLLAEAKTGRCVPYAIVLADTGEAIGCTALSDLNPQHKRLNIGPVWFGMRYWGQGYNLETNVLLLQHAFHTLQANRVAFFIDPDNHVSQTSFTRLGAQLEGRLRAHRLDRNGCVRDALLYSITWQEWPSLATQAQARLALCSLQKNLTVKEQQNA